MKHAPTGALLLALNNTPLALFAGVLIAFGLLAPKFLTAANAANVLIQSAPTAIVATGMTFVLLTAGVDLSVGAIMFLGAAVAGKLALGGAPLWAAVIAIIAIGIACGTVNALLVTRLRIIAFIATLGTLYVGRGLGLRITETRAMNLPDNFVALGSSRVLGVPVPLLVLAGVLVIAHAVLRHTPFGRQVYAVGADAEVARKAGIRVPIILASVYVISGLCAAIAGLLSLAQLGAVAPTFGSQKEFAAIAAAVLGGTSLFGGRGNVLPGTLFGAVLIQSLESGLVIVNADPYLYPLVTSAIIFLAVLLDSARSAVLARLSRRRIRQEPEST